MTTLDKDYCSKCKVKDVGLTAYAKRIDKNGNIVRYMNCHQCANERHKRSYNNNKEKYRQYSYDSIARYREKQSARCKLNYHLKKGSLIKPSNCEECGYSSSRIEGHHEDYSKPLEVRWLCTSCHNKI